MSAQQAAARDALLATYALFATGAGVAAIVPGRRILVRVSFWLGLLGCLAALVCAVAVWQGGSFDAPLLYWYGFGHAGLAVDPFAALFVLIVGGVGSAICLFAPGYLDRYGQRYSPRSFAVLLNLLLVSVLGCVTADNAVLFLAAWESLALLFYLLVAYQYDADEGPSAAYLTAAMAKAGGALVIGAYLLLAVEARSFTLTAIAGNAPTLPAGMRAAIFVLALIGFGVKLGAFPVQIWLPPGYRAAPSAASAAMAGIALNAGFYGLIRMLFTYLQPLPEWCGIAVLLVGAITAVLGILYGLAQANLKVFIAYSSVENVGIILIGIGLAVLARAQGILPLAALGLLAALYHLLGHAVAKALLFLGAGAIESSTGTTRLDRLGGLMRRMPVTAFTFLLGALALAALPPFSGFSSEWLMLEALMQGFRLHGSLQHVTIAVTGALLALTSSVALMAFVKVAGIGLLGGARTPETAQAADPPPLRALALVGLACCSVGLGVLAPWVVQLLGASAAPVIGLNVADRVVGDHLVIQPAYPAFSSADPTYLAFVLPLFFLVPVIFMLLARRRGDGGRVRRVPAWTSGSARIGPRVAYPAVAYSNPVRVIFTNIYRTRREVTVEGDPLFPAAVRYHSEVLPATELFLYRPLVAAALALSSLVRRLQSGFLSAYISYMLVVLLIAVIVFSNTV
jgi:hydrogenase-4 component B